MLIHHTFYILRGILDLQATDIIALSASVIRIGVIRPGVYLSYKSCLLEKHNKDLINKQKYLFIYYLDSIQKVISSAQTGPNVSTTSYLFIICQIKRK